MNSRESAAVLEFLSLGGAAFHSMRDNPAHVVDVMGGMWGAKVGAIRGEMAAAFGAMAGDVNARGKWEERDVDQARMQTAFWGKKNPPPLQREKSYSKNLCPIGNDSFSMLLSGVSRMPLRITFGPG